jgi:hypothetical protein
MTFNKMIHGAMAFGGGLVLMAWAGCDGLLELPDKNSCVIAADCLEGFECNADGLCVDELPEEGGCDESAYEYLMVTPQDGTTDHDPEAPLVYTWSSRPSDAYTGLQDAWGNYLIPDEEIDGDTVTLLYDLQPGRE